MAIEYLSNLGRAKDALQNMATSPVGEVLKNFAGESIEQMKSKLAGENRVTTGALASSLSFEITVQEGVITLDFIAEDYWDFINSGVDGVEQSAGAVQNAFESVYAFRHLVPSREMIDSFTGTGDLRGWMAAKGIQTLTYQDKAGNTVSKELQDDQDFRSAAFVFARAVKKHGIRPANFVNDVMSEEALEEFEDMIFNAYRKILNA